MLSFNHLFFFYSCYEILTGCFLEPSPTLAAYIWGDLHSRRTNNAECFEPMILPATLSTNSPNLTRVRLWSVSIFSNQVSMFSRRTWEIRDSSGRPRFVKGSNALGKPKTPFRLRNRTDVHWLAWFLFFGCGIDPDWLFQHFLLDHSFFGLHFFLRTSFRVGREWSVFVHSLFTVNLPWPVAEVLTTVLEDLGFLVETMVELEVVDVVEACLANLADILVWK